MTGTGAIAHALKSTQYMLKMYLADLSDADLLVRPVPEANHIAWQLGHMIYAERAMMSKEFPQEKFPELPDGFVEQHSKATAKTDPPKGFATKDGYLELFVKVRGATLSTLEKLTDADLDKPSVGDMAKYAPTLGAMFILQSDHTLMHAGQFTVVRRKLGKPVLF